MSQQKKKSNAPWILGIIGFILSLPIIICGIVCASASAQVAAEGGDEAGTAAAIGMIFVLPAVAAIASFILSFFGKSKYSLVTGILLVVLGLLQLYLYAVKLNVHAVVAKMMAVNIIAAVLFTFSGISSMLNAKKV